MSLGVWDRCIRHDEASVGEFLSTYLTDPSRRTLLVAAAGFDPRSMIFARQIAKTGQERVRAVILREERGNAAPELVLKGNSHEQELRELFADIDLVQHPIFAEDLAVVGGRKFVTALNGVDLDGLTDIFLDVSAMSVGVYFPLFCLLLSKAKSRSINLHLLLAANPETDRRAVPTYSDRIDSPHGMSFDMRVLSEKRRAGAGRLWLPQLRAGTHSESARIFDAVGPDDVCPILPFPSQDPRTADLIAASFASQFESWEVDPRSILLASDSNPLDIYSAIVRLSQARRHVFGDTTSEIVLTPMGAKATAVGMLLAAYELRLPVVTAEVLGYQLLDETLPAKDRLVHLWINGPILAQPAAAAIDETV